MFCSNCGKQLADDAKFCDGCGAKVATDASTAEKIDGQIKDGKVFKCPYCGEILPHNAVRCPTCGKEIRGREANKSAQSFFDKLEKTDDIDRRIELIKSYPISNSIEDILEFMFLASTAFDAKYYATNSRKDSVASAWLAKIDSCYEKAKLLFNDKKDLAQAESIHNKVHKDIQKAIKLKWLLIIGGAALIAAGLAIVSAFGQNNTAVGAIGLVLLAGGIVGLVFGLKRKKTNKEIEQEKIEKAKKNELKLAKSGKGPQKEFIVHETKVVHETAEPKVIYVDRPVVQNTAPATVVEEHVGEKKPAVEEKAVEEVNEEPKETVKSKEEIKQSGAVTYPREEVEVSPMFTLKQGEKILYKVDELIINDEDCFNVVVTNQAVYYLETDGEDVEECTRIPLCQISQVIRQRGGFLDDKYMEIYREGSVDRIEEDKMLPVLELAINDRFNAETVNRDYKYYSKINPKELK